MHAPPEPAPEKIATYRKTENLHIVFWLFKDISWCLGWKVLGISMIVPTLAIAIFLTRKFRTERSEFAHNLAIIFWIIANSYWMIAEFFGFDEAKFAYGFEGKHLAVIPFVLGMAVLANYYLLQPLLRKKRVPVSAVPLP